MKNEASRVVGAGVQESLKQSVPLSRFLGGFALLPAFLGGGTERWSQGLVLALLGLLLLAAPPKRSLGRGLNWALAGLLVCAATAFLPAKWFVIPPWRTAAVEVFSIPMGGWVTPQPWLTVEATALFAGGLAWFYFCCAIQGRIDRQVSLSWLCGSIIFLAVVSILFFMARTPFPYADPSFTFGPFPNRNQTAAVLCIGVVLSMACVQREFRRGNTGWIFWMIGCVVLIWALALAGSRAGIFLCMFGAAVWMGLLAMARRRSLSRFGFAAGFLLMMLGAFLLCGGDGLDRIVSYQLGVQSAHELRWPIQSAAMDLAKSAPITGIGLGNFAAEFWLSPRGALRGTDCYVVHPESDWLWCAVELGWTGVALVLWGLVLLVRRMLPLGKDPGWRMRSAAAAALLAFAIHGLVDVSGHRMGSVFAMIFTGSLALLPKSTAGESRWLPTLFRVAGLCFFLLGIAWVASHHTRALIPGEIGIESAYEQATQLNQTGGFEEAAAIASRAIHWAPLDWRFYYSRAVSNAFAGNWNPGLEDFRRARFLNPTSPDLPYNEGLVWLGTHPSLVFPAWQEALSRAGLESPAFYERMLRAAKELPADLRSALLEMAVGDSRLMVTFLRQARGAEFRTALELLLAGDANLERLSFANKTDLFRVWLANSEPESFAAQIKSHESWMPAGWPFVAESYAARGDFKLACAEVKRFLPPPVLPGPPPSEALGDLKRIFYVNPRNFTKGYALYTVQMRQNETEEALGTLEKLTAWPECPAYFHYLKAALLGRAGKWQESWAALKQGGFLKQSTRLDQSKALGFTPGETPKTGAPAEVQL